MAMSLAEVLLGALAVLAVTAASYVPYQTIRESNAERACLDSLVLLKANVGDVYGGWYGSPDFGNTETMVKLNIIPSYFLDPRTYHPKLHEPATIWGPVEIAASADGSEWSVAFKGLSERTCIHFARFRYRDWKRIQVGDQAAWTRSEGIPAALSRLEELCSADSAKPGGATVSFVDGL